MKGVAREDGFVMVEAVAALAVAAIAAAGLMTALSVANARGNETRFRDLALRQAQLLIVEALAANNLEDLPLRGEVREARLAWTRSIGPAGETYPGIRRIEVNVSWTSLQTKRTTRLEALRISPS